MKEFLFAPGDLVYDQNTQSLLLILSHIKLLNFCHYLSFDNELNLIENTCQYINVFYTKYDVNKEKEKDIIKYRK